MDAPPPRRTWVSTALIGLLAFGVFLANSRVAENEDTESTRLLAFGLARGDGLYLDRFRALVAPPGYLPPASITEVRGRLVSLYPVGPALLAVPIVWADQAARDQFRPGRGLNLVEQAGRAKSSAKLAAALITALACMGIDRILRRLGLGRVAAFAAGTAALASPFWSVAGQDLWQHGPAALALTALIALLLPTPTPRWRLVGAGLAAGTLVACRPVDAVFALAALGTIAATRPKGLAWFLPGLLGIGGAALAYNLQTFGRPLGGLAVLESFHPRLHGVDGTWSRDPIGGALGTLVSPSRGLFVFCPWVALALAMMPATWRSIRERPLLVGMLGGLAANLVVLSCYAVWWAGHSYGPRYWTDAVPVLAILLGYALDWCRTRCRPLLLAFALAILWGVGLQAIGAFLYPSAWNLAPANVDTHHERLWDWRDTEWTRCVEDWLKRRGG